ncbi:MAG: TIGR01906 family membrane protein [Anaerolineae bacterium]|nr:MAG: TIGR01906 family membrane protein [Anaerolineae bacterium]
MNKNSATVIVRWLVVLVMPFLVTFTTLRIIISWNSPDYPSFEYNRIAPDPYGFTLEERISYARASLDYLRMAEPAEEVINVLEELRLPDGQGSFYNDRELGHMIDVKKVLDSFKTATWISGIVVGLGLIFLLVDKERRSEGYKALFYGGAFTTGVVFVAIMLILLSWNFIFTQFHEILFPPNTWTFYYSDSLIRLFPEQFWFDFGVLWTVSIFVVGLLIGAAGYLLLKKAAN